MCIRTPVTTYKLCYAMLFKALRYLDIGYSWNQCVFSDSKSVSNPEFDAKVEASLITLGQLAHLHTLVMNSEGQKQLGEHVTDAVLQSIGAGCPRLERIGLGLCRGFSLAGLVALAKGCPLRKLDIFSCGKGLMCDDSQAAELLPHLANLLELRFPCREASDEVVVAIAEHCPQLRTLTLLGSERLSNAAVASLASSCPQLRDLDITSCPLLTDASLVSLTEGCEHLERLQLVHGGSWTLGGPKVTRQGVASAKLRRPSLKIEYLGMAPDDDLRPWPVSGQWLNQPTSIQEIFQQMREWMTFKRAHQPGGDDDFLEHEVLSFSF